MVITGENLRGMRNGFENTLRVMEEMEMLVVKFKACDSNCDGCKVRRSEIVRIRGVLAEIDKALSAHDTLTEAKAAKVASKLLKVVK